MSSTYDEEETKRVIVRQSEHTKRVRIYGVTWTVLFAIVGLGSTAIVTGGMVEAERIRAERDVKVQQLKVEK